jgi:cytosine/adenosine deaminase-related metal-dependent hydrolase
MLGILHFKFVTNWNARFGPEFSYHNFSQHGRERFQLAQALRRWGDNALTYNGTRLYGSSHDLREVLLESVQQLHRRRARDS